jgi:glycosyltransferase involved in cell wall biosynthesis
VIADLKPVKTQKHPAKGDVRVLVSAYACEPGQGSEPGGGWHWVCQIGRFEECWVITRVNNRPAIEKTLTANPMPGVHFIYYDLPRWARFWKRGKTGVRLYYYLWQAGVYRLARRLHRELNFSLIHHLTFANYWLPSFLPLLPVAFIWGPVGGAESAPPAFRKSFSLRGRIYEALRDTARPLSELNPFVRITARRAVASFAVTPETADRLTALGCRNVAVASQVALSLEEMAMLGKIPERRGRVFRVFSIGRLLHWKGFELGIRAFAEFHKLFPDSEYWLIGNGPEKERWLRLAEKLGVSDNITFFSTLPRAELLENIAKCDVLLHPSLHDSGGWVTMEAMAAGRPVICLDLGGPALQVTAATGIKIPAISPEQVIRDIVVALERIATDVPGRALLGRAGRARIEQDFNWQKLGDQMAVVYARLLNAPQIIELPAAEKSFRGGIVANE